MGEALVDLGVPRSDVVFLGGRRLEATVCPRAGFPFVSVELRGLQRSLTFANLGIPKVVARAAGQFRVEIERRRVGAMLGLGGYVTVPAALAAGRAEIPYALSEQNAGAGLANRLMSRRAGRVFGSFPHTHGLRRAEWVGNPIRRPLADFDRSKLRPAALDRWGFDAARPVLGVFGGSLGAGILNRAIGGFIEGWAGQELQVLHLAGEGSAVVADQARVSSHRWVVLDFCNEMDSFYAACDLVVARAGGSVAELTATGTPSILVPGGFGSGGHQAANAAALAEAGAAVVVSEDRITTLGPLIVGLLDNPPRREVMADACVKLARPQAASVIAKALIEMAGS